MPRAYNPFSASPYPTDPSFAAIGNNLVTAMFGDPELRMRDQIRRAQIEENQAQAQRALAAAGLDDERTRGFREQNDTVYGDGPTSLAATIPDLALLATARANPGKWDAGALNEGLAGLFLRNRIAARDPNAFTVAAPPAPPAPTGGLSSAVVGEGVPGTIAPDGAIEVAANKPAPPVDLPREDEQTLRLAALLSGKMSNENTALTPEYGDTRQRRDIAGARDRAGIAANAAIQGDRIRAGATIRSAQIGAGATMNGQRLTDARERGLGVFGPGARANSGNGQTLSDLFKPLNASATKDLDTEINNQMPFLKPQKNTPASTSQLRAKIKSRAAELVARGLVASNADAVQRAQQEFGVEFTEGEDRFDFGTGLRDVAPSIQFSSPEYKEVGGKRYVKIRGQWYEE